MRKPSIEDIKRRKNGLDVWHDIERCATAGYESLDPEALELFRWYGLYEQRPRRGLFMVRVRVPGGAITAVQARAVAQVGRDFAGGRIDVTTRQDLQLHSVPLRQIPEVIRRLHEAGLSTTFACGDTPRNVVACPLAGRIAGESADARDAVRAWERIHAANRSFVNLPRNLKRASAPARRSARSHRSTTSRSLGKREGAPGAERSTNQAMRCWWAGDSERAFSPPFPSMSGSPSTGSARWPRR